MINCSRTIFSQTLDATLSSDNGRLFEGCSWSPSFKSGMTSAIFKSDGKVEVTSEQLIISVIGPSITCRASLNTLALVLSGPGALFNGKDKMVRLTTSMLTGVNLNQSSENDTRSGMDEFEQMMLFSNASFATASAVRLPTDEKYELNSLANSYMVNHRLAAKLQLIFCF